MNAFARSLFSGIGLVLVLTVPAYGKDDAKEVKKIVASVDQDGVQRVEILGGGYFFNPNYVVVKVNIPVELTVRRESGWTPHDLVIKAPEAGIEVSVNLETEPQVVKFTPTKPGIYPILCTEKFLFFESHKDKGMEGVLDVVE